MRKQGAVVQWNAEEGLGLIRSPQTAAFIRFHLRDYKGPLPIQVGQPYVQSRTVRRGQCALIEQDIAGEQHTRALVENRQVGAGMPAQRQQLQAPVADRKYAFLYLFGGQHHLGATHPVADQAVHVLCHRIALLGQQPAGLG